MCKPFKLSCTSLSVLFLLQARATPLHLAASAGHHETCEALLEKGANVDSPDYVSAAISGEDMV